MKKFLLWSLCFLLITAIIPFCVRIEWDYSELFKSKSDSVSSDKIKTATLTQEEIDAICCISMEYIDDDTNETGKSAILSLCANNYIYTKNSENNSVKPEISTYNDSLLKELHEIISEGLIELFYKGNNVYIPMVTVTDGYITTADEYPYIESIASPWDKFSSKYPPNVPDECGISIEGLKYLCETYGDAEKALKWYLPEFEIKLTKFT